ncbi:MULTISPECIES: UTRA domain-containing protein [Streptomyces]|uniref:UTRA domain-containing protein n=1 Tax=Streptomyces TaxID=1883 RepID=UPI00163C739D|nr:MULTISPECIES: UTRA domain-containing protein [Streptomyces]MBC2875098.1 UTRA domain-containing protein [Streptomyces sp. TYQ1024]UBI36936.1 UTRA domain-containing protein [Streptomyces mobaraensis]UKW29529.1 UTRA domain-containing protein [Streptomyces sp. TYQ1024]
MSDRQWESESARYLVPRGPGRPEAWAEEAAERKGRGRQRLLEAGVVEPSDDVTRALQLAADERVVVRRRLVLFDDAPVEIVTSHFPGRIADGTPLAAPGKVPGGAVTFLAGLGYLAKKVEEGVGCRMPTAEERELLRLGEHEPVLVVSRLVLTDGDLPVEVCEMVMNARDRTVRYRMRMG